MALVPSLGGVSAQASTCNVFTKVCLFCPLVDWLTQIKSKKDLPITFGKCNCSLWQSLTPPPAVQQTIWFTFWFADVTKSLSGLKVTEEEKSEKHFNINPDILASKTKQKKKYVQNFRFFFFFSHALLLQGATLHVTAMSGFWRVFFTSKKISLFYEFLDV